MFQSDDFDEDFFNDILEPDNSNHSNKQKEFVFQPDIGIKNAPSTSSRNENIIDKIFSKPTIPFKSPNKKVVKRKFPGPAGLLPEKTVDVSINNLENDSNKTVAPDEIICSQVSENCFKESPWIDMCKDHFIEAKKYSLADKYSIHWAKTKAMTKQLLGQKTPFLAAIIKNIDYSIKNPLVTLKDPTGEMAGTLDHEVWEEYSEKLNVGSVIVLIQVGVLRTLKKYYLNITLNNIIKIYHFKEAPVAQITQVLTQSNLTQRTQRTQQNYEVIQIRNVSANGILSSIETFRRTFQDRPNLAVEENDNPFFNRSINLNFDDWPQNSNVLQNFDIRPQNQLQSFSNQPQSIKTPQFVHDQSQNRLQMNSNPQNLSNRPQNQFQSFKTPQNVPYRSQNQLQNFSDTQNTDTRLQNFMNLLQNSNNEAQNVNKPPNFDNRLQSLNHSPQNFNNRVPSLENQTQNLIPLQNIENRSQFNKQSQISIVRPQNFSSGPQNAFEVVRNGQNQRAMPNFNVTNKSAAPNKFVFNPKLVDSNSNQSKLSSGVHSGEHLLKRPKLDPPHPFSEDFISETPEVLNRFDFENDRNVFNKNQHFSRVNRDFNDSIISETPENSENVAFTKDIISATPETINRNFNFNKCDKRMQSESNKNIFCNDNFVDGLEESFLEDF